MGPAAALFAGLVVMHGLVTMGPTSPACAETTSPCSKPAAHALIQFTGAGGWHVVTTDAKGRYTIHIAPGVWTVEISSGVMTTPHRITVRPVATLRRDFKVDTGIR